MGKGISSNTAWARYWSMMSTPYRVIVNAMVGAGVERRRRWFVGTIFASLGDQFVHVSGSKIVELFKVYSILRVGDWVQCVLELGSYRAFQRPCLDIVFFKVLSNLHLSLMPWSWETFVILLLSSDYINGFFNLFDGSLVSADGDQRSGLKLARRS